jgi:hypothetical protein
MAFMIRFVQRYFAIRSYVWRLSQELARRFGTKSYYTLEEVTGAAQSSGSKMAFIAYAHAMFCKRADFEARYDPLRAAGTYDRLRARVSRSYFGGARDFDAATIVRATKRLQREENTYYESGLGY